jgi:hypothetical protein
MTHVKCPSCGQLILPVGKRYYCIGCNPDIDAEVVMAAARKNARQQAKVTERDREFLKAIMIRWE